MLSNKSSDVSSKIFLTARWEYLAMFNFEVDASVLTPHLPPFTEIDYFQGKVLVSVVGFLFKNTKVLGVAWPGHVNFEEVNLRYYLKHYDGKEWKRGVGFISEIVPKKIIAWMANVLYNEHYSVARMNHTIKKTTDQLSVEYTWGKYGEENSMILITEPHSISIEKDSEEEFIFDHYVGFNKLSDTRSVMYTLEHAPWEVYPVKQHTLRCNFEKLYGEEFAPYLTTKPHSVFLAKGSEVSVKRPKILR